MDKLASIGGKNYLAPADAYEQTSAADKAKKLSQRSVKSEKELNKAAGGFEALLLHQMLQAMWSTVDTAGLLGENSNQYQIYQDMFQQAVADKVAEGQGIGVKQFMKKELLKSMKKASEGV
jgi:Rod binding domain-containing protein